MSSPEFSNMAPSDQDLQAALQREQSLHENIQSFASEQGLNWLFDDRSETIREQSKVAYMGHTLMHDAFVLSGCTQFLGKTYHQTSEHEFNGILEAKLTKWAEPSADTNFSTLDYIAKQQMDDPDLEYTLVATPNTLVGEEQIAAVATQFGMQQQRSTWYLDIDYDRGRTKFYRKYSAEQLSGEPEASDNDFAPIRFSLIPNRPSKALGTMSVDMQRNRLAAMQIKTPESTLHVPSVLTNVSRWFTLRAAQLELNPDDSALHLDDIIDRTLVRHIDLPPKKVGGDLFVPRSFVAGGGGAYLGVSVVGAGGNAVVAVG